MKTWFGTTTCDFCGKTCEKELVDGLTQIGGWAVMCPKCHKIHGCGLGTGRGQKYVKDANGNFVKVEKKPKAGKLRSMMVRAGIDMGLTREEAEMEADDYLAACA